MMNCQKNLKNLGEIADGSAPFMHRMAFYMHIAMCNKCRLYYKQFKEMQDAASELTEADLPDDFFKIMEHAIPQAETDPSS